MKRKHYERPSLEVVVLNHNAALLQASGQAGVQDYTFENVVQE
jgi:hypothetical protein